MIWLLPHHIDIIAYLLQLWQLTIPHGLKRDLKIKSPKKDVGPLGKLDNRMGNGGDVPKTAEDGAGKIVAGKKRKENPAGTSDEAAEKVLSKYHSQSIVHLVAAQPKQQVAWATPPFNPYPLPFC